MILRNGKYKVLWQQYGYTWAQPVIHVRKRFLGFEYWREVAKTGYIHRQSDLSWFSEEKLAHWFEEAIRSYEKNEEKKVEYNASPAHQYRKPRWL